MSTRYFLMCLTCQQKISIADRSFHGRALTPEAKRDLPEFSMKHVTHDLKILSEYDEIDRKKQASEYKAQHEKDTGLIAQQSLEIIKSNNLLEQLLEIIDSPNAPFVGNLRTDDIVHDYYCRLHTAIKDYVAIRGKK